MQHCNHKSCPYTSAKVTQNKGANLAPKPRTMDLRATLLLSHGLQLAEDPSADTKGPIQTQPLKMHIL